MTTPVTNFKANVLLPVSIINMDKPALASSTQMKTCPHVNNPNYVPGLVESPLNIINGITNSPLTTFGNFLVKLIIGEFNTVYGTNFLPTDVSVATDPSPDQNATCAYQITVNANLVITCYVQLASSVHVSFSLEEANLVNMNPVASTSSSSTPVA